MPGANESRKSSPGEPDRCNLEYGRGVSHSARGAPRQILDVSLFSLCFFVSFLINSLLKFTLRL